MAASAMPNTRRRSASAMHTAKRALFTVIAFGIAAVTIFPVYWMVVSAVQPSKYSTAYPPPFWPKHINLAPFRLLFEKSPIERWLLNSTFLAALTTALCLALAIFGAFALSALRWRGRTGFAFLLLLTQMLPEALIVVPIFGLYRQVHLRESLPGLSLVDVAFVLPVGIFILKNVFDTIPREIVDAALVDGCSPMGTLWRIMLPLSVPGLVAVSVVAFFYAWNEFLFASTMVTSETIRPASLGLSTLQSMLDTPIERLLAAGLVFALPPVIFYLIVQRYVVAGLTAGAVKG